MDEFFRDFHQKVTGVVYSLEATIVGGLAPPTRKRSTTTVRAPFLSQTPKMGYDCSRDVEDAVVGVWHGDGRASYEISYDEQGRLMFKNGKREGELLAGADGDSLVATLVNLDGSVHGHIKLRLRSDSLVSSFRKSGRTIWNKDITSMRTKQQWGNKVLESLTSQEPTPRGEPLAPRSCSRSTRAVPEAGVMRRPHAKAVRPQDLHFTVPVDCTPGQAVCLVGIHGDPVRVPLPEGALPGTPCSVRIGPEAMFQVVPEGALPGSTVVFTMEGHMFNTSVPPGKMPGDSFEIPVVVVQVPPLVKPGDEVTYTTPMGGSAVVQIPAGLTTGQIFPVLMPMADLQEDPTIQTGEGDNAPQLSSASTMERVPPAFGAHKKQFQANEAMAMFPLQPNHPEQPQQPDQVPEPDRLLDFDLLGEIVEKQLTQDRRQKRRTFDLNDCWSPISPAETQGCPRTKLVI